MFVAGTNFTYCLADTIVGERLGTDILEAPWDLFPQGRTKITQIRGV